MNVYYKFIFLIYDIFKYFWLKMLSFKVDIYFKIILFIGMFLKGISFFGKVVFGINEEIVSVVYFILKYKFGI